jgi:hypothetical protein
VCEHRGLASGTGGAETGITDPGFAPDLTGDNHFFRRAIGRAVNGTPGAVTVAVPKTAPYTANFTAIYANISRGLPIHCRGETSRAQPSTESPSGHSTDHATNHCMLRTTKRSHGCASRAGLSGRAGRADDRMSNHVGELGSTSRSGDVSRADSSGTERRRRDVANTRSTARLSRRIVARIQNRVHHGRPP